MILDLQQGLLADGFAVPLTKLCAWFGVPRRTVYYKPLKAPPKIDPAFEEPIKAMIEENPSFGYRTVAWLLGFNSEPRSAPPVRAPRRTSCSGSSSWRAGPLSAASCGCACRATGAQEARGRKTEN